MGETLRRCAKDRSSGSPEASSTGTSGIRSPLASDMVRTVLRRYSARACCGMSLGGKILAEEAFQVAALGLADHLARAVVGEAIDHDAVIAEHGLHQPRGIPDQAIDVVDIPQPAQHGPGEGQRLLVHFRGFLEFDNHRRFKAVNSNVEEFSLAQAEPEYQGRPRRVIGSRQCVAHAVGGIRPQQDFERPAIDLALDPEHRGQVARMTQDNRCVDVGGDQAAMTLYAAGNMDRLPVAIGQVKLVVRRHPVIPWFPQAEFEKHEFRARSARNQPWNGIARSDDRQRRAPGMYLRASGNAGYSMASGELQPGWRWEVLERAKHRAVPFLRCYLGRGQPSGANAHRRDGLRNARARRIIHA